ncbi:hypothetical protein [Georgenia sp. H159]|uniref:hypothetical protein n=1 Tax=Georgenia sp. H159 TaxID=3076115 RepID=UPI002D76B40F|nr:hypothetical protein [Georgenia sp. H159]
MPTYLDKLAALRDGGRLRHTTHRDERPFRRKLDSDGSGRSIEAPGTRTLARVFVLPWLTDTGREPFRARSSVALLTRPTGSSEEPTAANVLTLADELREVLAALPERPDAGRPYNDVRFLVTVADRRTAEEYTRAAIQHARRLAPHWSSPRPEKPVPSGPTLTDAERVRAYRARIRREGETSARRFIQAALARGRDDDHDPEDLVLRRGARIAAAELWATAESEFLFIDGDVEDDGHVWRLPGRTTFYAVADEMLGARRRVNGTRVYVIPELPAEPEEADPMDTATAMLFDRTAEILADRHEERLARLRSGDYAGALTLQREAATGTDGGVVDLAAVRARRAR